MQTSSWPVLGVDPGLAITGYAFLSMNSAQHVFEVLEYGVIRTPATSSLEDRLCKLYTELVALVQKYKPQVAGCEKVFFSRNVKTAIDVNQARGVILLALRQAGIHVTHLTPTTIKQSITGYGSANKTQVQYMVQQALHLQQLPQQDDAADALAVAIATAGLHNHVGL